MHTSVKNATSNFHPPLRIVIATMAFGMDNCPDVHQIIHRGVPQNADMYVQEIGRAERDGKLSWALILTSLHIG